MDISGKTAIVTGSARGVGAATAKLLAEKGCNVVINYSKSDEQARESEEICRRCGVETLLCRADVADDTDCRRMVDETLGKWGRLDILINNAGTTKFCAHSDLDGLSKDDFLRIYGVNVVGTYQMVRAAAPHMKRKGKGSVVNVASVAGITGIGSSIAYAASKGALITMTLSLARILGPEIRVNAVCPGFIQGSWLREGMGVEIYEKLKLDLEAAAPLHMTATPQTVAESIVHFAAGMPLVTGETLILDGGFHLNTTPMARR
ncbi:MAG: glucose 1-dehydrogenase [Syntrophales bacterium]|jgi:3-oxoacyl-[acyl-carrier protein] reductase|nr:glucose 1-dehydrogenase [Syntrophales bacterium]MDY0045642.1 glucose 1-dehydrogenase [Syntrophales bacterium]